MLDVLVNIIYEIDGVEGTSGLYMALKPDVLDLVCEDQEDVGLNYKEVLGTVICITLSKKDQKRKTIFVEN